MKSKAYAASPVNRVDAVKVVKGGEGESLILGMDVGKYKLFAVARWPDGTFERP